MVSYRLARHQKHAARNRYEDHHEHDEQSTEDGSLGNTRLIERRSIRHLYLIRLIFE